MKSIIVAILIIGLVITTLIMSRPVVQAELQVIAPTRVVLTSTRSSQVTPLTHITGRLQPSRKSSLQFEVSGRLVARHVEPGQAVAEGEVLLEIEDGDLQDALLNARASLQQEEAEIARDRELLRLSAEEQSLLMNEVRRLKKLEQDSLSSLSRSDEVQRQLLNLQAAESRLRFSVNTAPARLRKAQVAVNVAERNLARARLRAPFASSVNSVQVEPGDYVTPGQAALSLVQVEMLDLALEVPGDVISALSIGQQIELQLGSESRQGRVIARAVDPSAQTLTYALRIRISGQGAVAGQLAEARLPGQTIDAAILVPRPAILREEGGAYVFVVEQNTLKRQAVKILLADGDDFVIRGLQSGVSIVARNVAALADGQQIVTD